MVSVFVATGTQLFQFPWIQDNACFSSRDQKNNDSFSSQGHKNALVSVPVATRTRMSKFPWPQERDYFCLIATKPDFSAPIAKNTIGTVPLTTWTRLFQFRKPQKTQLFQLPSPQEHISFNPRLLHCYQCHVAIWEHVLIMFKLFSKHYTLNINLVVLDIHCRRWLIMTVDKRNNVSSRWSSDQKRTFVLSTHVFCAQSNRSYIVRSLSSPVGSGDKHNLQGT